MTIDLTLWQTVSLILAVLLILVIRKSFRMTAEIRRLRILASENDTSAKIARNEANAQKRYKDQYSIKQEKLEATVREIVTLVDDRHGISIVKKDEDG